MLFHVPLAEKKLRETDKFNTNKALFLKDHHNLAMSSSKKSTLSCYATKQAPYIEQSISVTIPEATPPITVDYLLF